MARTAEVELRWIQPPKQARSQRTLERILDSAEILISEKGFADTSVAELGCRAGSSVGAFYARFQDKDGLLHALYDRYLEQATATADDALDRERWKDSSVREIVSEVVRFLVAIYREQAGMIRAFVLRNRSDPEFQLRQERLSQYVSDKLTALLLERRGEIGHNDPELALRLGFSMVLGTIENEVLFGELRCGPRELSDDDFSDELTRAYLAYLAVDPRPEPRPPIGA